jgi:hypothetical protein
MNKDNHDQLEARLARVERTNKLLLGVCAISIGLFVMSCGQPAGQAGGAMRTQRLEIVDANGNVRGLFVADQQGAILSLDDAQGRPRVSLASGADRPGLELFDDEGRPQVALTAERDGANLAISDVNGNLRATLGLYREEGWLAFLNPAGEVLHTVPPTQQN